jgi:hypothetical protein
MMSLGLLLLAGLFVASAVVAGRLLDSAVWRRTLRAYRLRLPAGLTAEQLGIWLATVTAIGGSSLRLLNAPSVVLETVASSKGIDNFLLIPSSREAGVLASLRAALPGVRIEAAPDYSGESASSFRAARELRVTSLTRPLASERAEATAAAVLASLQPLGSSTSVRMQWLLTGSRTPHPSTLAKEQDGLSLLTGISARDREAIRAERLKHAEPLLRACCRIEVTSDSRAAAAALVNRLIGALRLMNAPGIMLQPRLLPGWWVAEGIRKRAVPVLAWPLLLNSREAAGLVGLPVGELHLPGLTLGAARQLPPAPQMARRGSVIGVSNYPGTERPLALLASDRLRHTWILGPTGAGKSTLMGSMALQDMHRGDGLVAIDARGDLIPDLLNRIPETRLDDVIVLDPSKTDRPIGFNILQAADHDLAVDHVLHVLHDLYSSSWGPRTADILRAGLLTLVHAKAPDGGPFTLVELPVLLSNPRFRHFVLRQGELLPGLNEFWQWYENLSDAERANILGPVMNKLRAFTLKKSLRLLLGQPDGLQLKQIFTDRKILLVPLSKGALGSETAQLVGSLLMSYLWQTTMNRVHVPADKRRPVWLYIDEFQEVVRLPLDLADMLAQARGLGVGLTLAHQYLAQLSENVKNAILGTTRTQITFQCEYPDANVLARSFAPLTRDDLMGLDAHEIAMRPCVNAKTLGAVTATTLPFAEPIADGKALASASRDRYGRPASEVEAAISARVAGTVPLRVVGRTPRESSP